MKKELIIISGPSGVGKKTVIQAIIRSSDLFLVSISATTRKPRTGEINGQDYYFLTKKQFEQRIKEDSFVEWAKVHRHYYGTPKENLIQAKKNHQHLVLEIDVQGALQIQKKYPGKTLLIFILPPKFEELYARLHKRGSESEDEIKKRLDTAKLEMQYANQYDYRVINDEVSRAANEIISIVGLGEGRNRYEKKH